MGKSVEEVRAEIPFLGTGIIYLDSAATTPTPQPVIDAMLEYFREYGANIGRGLHRAAKRATEEFEAVPWQLLDFEKYAELQVRPTHLKVRHRFPLPGKWTQDNPPRAFSFFSSYGCPEPCTFCCSK